VEDWIEIALSVGRVYLQKGAERIQFHPITLTLECPLAPQPDINTEFNTWCYTVHATLPAIWCTD